ncbi:hypothetical protein ACHAQA_000652 [Verticillium albo-atrum]
MCHNVETLFTLCGHREFQHTFKCRSARGETLGHPTRGLTLPHTEHLPGLAPSEHEKALCSEKPKGCAVMPKVERCRDCRRKARKEREGKV